MNFMNDFILVIPKWTGEIVFSPEVVKLIMIMLLLITGFLMCIKGYNCFQTALFIGIAGIAAICSYHISQLLTDNLVIILFITVSLTFLIVCLAYFISMIISFFLDKTRLRLFLLKSSPVWTCILGAVLLFGTIYFGIYQNILIVCLISAGVGGLGGFVQHKNREKRIQFRTYNDLLKLKAISSEE